MNPPPCSIVSFSFGITLIVLLVAGLILFGLFSNMLRDYINDYATFVSNAQRTFKWRTFVITGKVRNIKRPYSLSKTQLAFWTGIVTGSFIYLYFCKYCGIGVLIESSTLAMLGVSIGTTAGGVLIDKSQDRLPRQQNFPSQNFFLDILSDENGVSIARFQQVIWNIIAAVIYISQLKNIGPGHLPKLDPSILALSGLSNAAYLALKAGENTGNGLNMTIANNLQNLPPIGRQNLAAAGKPPEKGNQKQP